MYYKSIKEFIKSYSLLNISDDDDDETSIIQYDPFIFENQVKDLIEDGSENSIKLLEKSIIQFNNFILKCESNFLNDFDQCQMISITIIRIFEFDTSNTLIKHKLSFLVDWTCKQNIANDIFAESLMFDYLS